MVSGNRFGHVLADDVGLGKTIEAGLIIISLLRREPPQRMLIVYPAGLALHWQDELEDHFNLFFNILGMNFAGKRLSSWRTQTAVIAPIDRIKREEYRELLLQVGTFDLVICDEAHRLTARRNELTQDLEKSANYRLFKFLLESRLMAQEARLLAENEVMGLIDGAGPATSRAGGPVSAIELNAARRVAQQVLRERLDGRDAGVRSTAGLSPLLAARIST